jgi:Domain of unknown function (DUF6908)
MKTVAKIIESYGGLQWLRQPGTTSASTARPTCGWSLSTSAPDRAERRPSPWPTYEQNGDAMRDPEIVFEVNPDAWNTGECCPVSYRHDNLNIYQEAVYLAILMQ